MRLQLGTVLLCLAVGGKPATPSSAARSSADAPHAAIGPATSTTASDTGWFWFASCARPQRMVLELTLDGRLLKRRTFSACHLVRDRLLDSIQYHTDLMTSFHAPRFLVWKGYRSDADTTPSGIHLDVDIWEADTGPFDKGPPGIVLGVWAAGPDSLYMNTVHVAIFGETDTTELAEGLRVVTKPLRSSSK